MTDDDTTSTTTTSKAKNASDMIPWVERYRPRTLADVSHQTEVVSTLQRAVSTSTSTGNLPHLLLYGPAGTGKTSVALALCKQLWHPSIWRNRVLELNASDDRGIGIVRDKIKTFACLAVGSSPTDGGSTTITTKNSSFFSNKNDNANDDNANDDNANDDTDGESSSKPYYPNPPFKIIILDEADTVTPDAQAALRRIIEAHSRVTRFILICNYVTRIIEPLASRCAKFRFQSLPPNSMKGRLAEICHAENCSTSSAVIVTDETLDCILQICHGDMRRAVTTLQSVYALSTTATTAVANNNNKDGSNNNNNNDDDTTPTVTVDTLAEMAGLPPPYVVNELWKALEQKEDENQNKQHSSSSSSFVTMQMAVEDVCAQGFSAHVILQALSERMITSSALDEVGKANLAIRIAVAEKNLVDGADEYLQLLTVCSLAMTCLEASKSSKK